MVHQEDGQVADHLARRRHFHDVAQRHVDFRIGARDLVPARAQPHGFGLLAQIGVLAAGHLVDIHFGRAGLRAGIERRIVRPHGFPVIGALVERVQVEAGIARRVAERRHDGVQIRLAGGAAHGGDGAVGHMHARFGRFQHRGGIDAAGIVRVEVDRNADFLPQRAHQLLGRVGLAQPGHIFDGEHVRAHALQFARHLHVILRANTCRGAGRGCRRYSRPRLRRSCRSCARPPWGSSCSAASSANRRCGRCRCPARRLRG